MSTRLPEAALPESAVLPPAPTSGPAQSVLGGYLAEVERVPLLTREEEQAIGRSIDAAERTALTAVLSRASGRSGITRLARDLETGAVRLYDVAHVEPGGSCTPEAARHHCARLLRAAATARTPDAISTIVRLRLTRTAFERLHTAVDEDLERGPERSRALRAIRAGRAASDRAKARLVEANLRLVVAIAAKMRRSRLGLSDLVQEGNLGLLHAVDKFDYTRGFKFSTYATWWIKQHIRRGAVERGSTIRLPVHISEAQARVKRAEQRLLARTAGLASADDIAREAAVSASQVATLLALPMEPTSVDAPLRGEAQATLLDRLQSNDPLPDERAEENERRRGIVRMLVVLRPRHRTVLELRYGLVDGKFRSLDEVGREMGMTRERVRQIEQAALSHLRALPRQDMR